MADRALTAVEICVIPNSKTVSAQILCRTWSLNQAAAVLEVITRFSVGGLLVSNALYSGALTTTNCALTDLE